MTLIFWVCAGLIAYVYFGYPALLASGILGRRRQVKRGQVFPTISVIIPAHNEERMLASKLRNLLAQDYPRENFEILVGDDGSTDGTEDAARHFAAGGVRVVRSESQRGKSSIQNLLVDASTGDVLVFTDADCLLPGDALKTIVQSLADPEVGLVTNCAVISNKNETGVVESESMYWRYERWLRMEESERGLLAMASGSLFAMRRALWQPLDANVGDDFVLPLHVARSGFRNVLETRTSAETRLTQNESRSMLRMKVRIISKDLRGLLKNGSCLNPFRTGFVAVGLWSHKLLRWFIPYFLILLFVSNAAMAGREPYKFFLAAQVLFYLVAAAGMLAGERHFRFPFSVVYSFCLVNLAALLGTLHCVSMRPAGQWKTVR